MSFMKPVIYHGDFYLVGGQHGTDLIPVDVAGDIGLETGREMDIDDNSVIWVPAVNALMDYTENGDDITSIERMTGFYGRYSAPGYLDCTAWTWGATEEAVEAALNSMYGDKSVR